MSQLAGFLDVLLRGLGLVSLSAAVGGVAFLLMILPRSPGPAAHGPEAAARSLRLIRLGALCVAGCQALLVLVIHPWALTDPAGRWPIGEFLGTIFGIASLVRIAAAAVLAAVAGRLIVRPQAPAVRALLVGGAALLLAEGAWLTHGTSRLEHRGLLMTLTIVHQGCSALWLGGVLHLVSLDRWLRRRADPAGLAPAAARFSPLALAAMTATIGAGTILAWSYAGSPAALAGTGYGLMVLTKVALLAAVLVLGGLNFRLLRRPRRLDPRDARLRLSTFLEVEAGLGVILMLVASSLTSLPPAIDVVADRATPAEVAQRFLPGLPRLSSPPVQALLEQAGRIDDSLATRQPVEKIWSEYNHHMAGLFVFLMGLLALLDRTGRVAWARHWPLSLLGLAAFIAIRADPRAWPLGPAGFWETMRLPDVLQHRLAALLVVALALFEWLVRTGRLAAPRWRLVFPLLAAAGGALLLTHSHALVNLKAEYLAEVSHTPMGLLALMVGGGRWLELRLPPGDARWAGRIWSGALLLLGALLLVYREP